MNNKLDVLNSAFKFYLILGLLRLAPRGMRFSIVAPEFWLRVGKPASLFVSQKETLLNPLLKYLPCTTVSF